MTKLELLIPPVALVLIVAALMWVVSVLLPAPSVLGSFGLMIGGAFALIGVWVAVSGVRAFRVAATTVNPMTPDDASTLVDTGIYQYTRNPMYLGFMLVLLGFGIYLGNIYSLFCVAGFVIYMTRFQIMPEERALRDLFGEAFEQYCQRVRRWL